MKTAIVTGGFGRLGSELVSLLARHGIPTLGVGRLTSPNDQLYEVVDCGGMITRVLLAPGAFRTFSDIAPHIPWEAGKDSVLFHLAWGALGQLAVPSISHQIGSAGLMADAVNLAATYGCTRLVNAGSQQERFVEDYLVSDWKSLPYPTSQGLYGAAKLIARDLGSVLCYLKHIDFINVRFSTYVTPDLQGPGYIASVLRSILEDREYQQPNSTQWCELLPIAEVARAFALIGERGRNKADYYIGTDRPRTLAEHFDYFARVVRGSTDPKSGWRSAPLCERDRRHFDPAPLYEDVGFTLEENFETFSQGIARR